MITTHGEKRLNFAIHEDDNWFDEVQLIHEGEPVIRCVTRYRYKTSGLSGDEWRTSVVWQTKR